MIDPRTTDTAQEADVHLAPRVGTNVAVLNGLLHLIIEAGRIDRDFLDAHTVGFDELEETVAPYPPERVEEIAGVPARQLRAAAEILGTAPSAGLDRPPGRLPVEPGDAPRPCRSTTCT